MIKMQIITSPGCECCEDIKTYIKDVQKDFPELQVDIISMTTSLGQELVQKYNILSAPGIIINGKLEFSGETKEEDLRKKLKEIII
ncbi:MAG: thioredoxin family protein [Candidatus Nealsonbacteria bacterium]|nr:thioredoxin family protein [Candidatus Nealsonbacteria bacterium]